MEVAFAIPGRIDTRTGGYAYARRVLQHASAHGLAMQRLELPAAFPCPSTADLLETERLLKNVPSQAIVLADGLAYGALPADLVGRVDRRIVALVHHPLGLESGLDAASRERLIACERVALACACRVIVTSSTTARTLVSDFGVPEARLAIAEPGTDRALRASGSPPGAPVRLLAVGTIVPRKACDVLVAALAGLADQAWRLDIIGSLDRDRGASRALEAQIAAADLGDRIRLHGEVSEAELAAAYDGADVFVSPSLYEGYGMVLGEAMARGLPIVVTTGGAAGETVPAGAGLKVPPGDILALRAALDRIIADRQLRTRLGEGSWSAGQRLPTWDETTARIAAVLRGVADPPD
ncbi:MAG: glycosyltransferase family 4 protein [Methylobacteriaceae bacterium]|nr:glycosyltransferase family 4 protein [Methylobacteriaceae bacterium]